MDRVTFSGSSGAVWLILALHFAAGLVSTVAGALALSVAKGERIHKQSGLVFTATGIGAYENSPSPFASCHCTCCSPSRRS